MVSRDTWFLTLLLVSAFLVVSMDARSWDIAVAIGQQIDYFAQNGTGMGQSKVANSTSLTGLAYDSTTRTMYMSDAQNKHISIYSNNLTETKPTSHPILPHMDHTHIMAIVFDPISRSLFWTDGLRHVLMKMEVPLHGDPRSPVVLHDLKEHSPHGIALDICNRFIYWTNSNYSLRSIERSRLDGSERSVIVNSENLYAPYGIAIDHIEGKLYWTDDEEGVNYKIERSNLDGTDRELLTRGKHHLPVYMAVDKNFVYWTDWTSNAVWKINKIKDESGPLEMMSYMNSHRSIYIMSIITRDNIGDINCNAMIKRERERLKNTSTPLLPIDSINNITASWEEGNSTDQLAKNCLNGGLYDELAATCLCKKGFTGVLCETSICHNYCNHGHCNVDDKGSPRCTCGASYMGERCEKNMCTGYCLNNGVCSISSGRPTCECKNSHGDRCEFPNELYTLCALYCMGTEEMLSSMSIPLCRCSEFNQTLPESFITTAKPLISSTIILSVLASVIGILVIVIGVLSYHVTKLRRRPRIRKRFVVSKGAVTPLTSAPQLPSDSCEITIENCCNMNICETPCFEPKLRPTSSKSNSTKKEEKNSLLDSMEGADSC